MAKSYFLEKNIDGVIARISNTIVVNQRSRYGMVVLIDEIIAFTKKQMAIVH